VCLFLRKESEEERNMWERKYFFCLEHSKKAKERKNSMGPTQKNFPQQYEQDGFGETTTFL